LENTYLPLGTHVFGNLFNCQNVLLLEDENYTKKLLHDAAKASGATPLVFSFYKFEPHGVTATLILSESHISIHSYPDHATVFVDVFTCGEHTTPQYGVRHILDTLGSKTNNVSTVKREATI
jgi:S-adenosylmethionine decarboxylase